MSNDLSVILPCKFCTSKRRGDRSNWVKEILQLHLPALHGPVQGAQLQGLHVRCTERIHGVLLLLVVFGVMERLQDAFILRTSTIHQHDAINSSLERRKGINSTRKGKEERIGRPCTRLVRQRGFPSAHQISFSLHG